MAMFEIEYVKSYADRHGKMRYYFRRKGYKTQALRGPIGSSEFFEDYDAALKAGPINIVPGASLTKPGSISDLFVQYYASAKFKKVGPVGQKRYRGVLEAFRSSALPNGVKFGDLPVAAIRGKHLLAILDGLSDKPGAATMLLKRLKTVFQFAIEREFRTDNPAMHIKPPRLGGFRALDEADIDQYLAHWKPGTPQRRAMIVLLYTGQRRSDAVKMGRQHIRNGRISLVQQKTGARLEITIHPTLQAEIDLMPAGQMMFITGKQGKPMTSASFGNEFRQWCREADLPENSSPHGCRKAAGRRLAEAGASTRQIMAILGHASLSEAERYTASANQVTLADEGIAKLK